MIFILLLALIFLRYSTGTRAIAWLMGGALGILATLIYWRTSDEVNLVALGFSSALWLTIWSWVSRVDTSVDLLRIHKG